MRKCKVLIPFARRLGNNRKNYVEGDEISLAPREASRMAQAGIVEILDGEVGKIEVAELPDSKVEKAVRRHNAKRKTAKKTAKKSKADK